MAVACFLSTGYASAVVAESANGRPLPKVLIVGDSISIGYTKHLDAMLKDVAQVRHNPGNAAHTQNGVERLDGWLAGAKYDVIHFNWGLHDLKYVKDGKLDLSGTRLATLEEYKANLNILVGKLKATGAKLVWASTTPIPPGAEGRIPGSEGEFNKAAREIMDTHGIRVNDLHSYVAPYLIQYQRPKNVHFTQAGSEYLAQKVARTIAGMLRNPAPPFAMPEVKPPVFPKHTVNIRDHGAVAGGTTMNTQAIAKAIAACAEAGGGRVVIPAGDWLTGAIHLKSNIDLHLEQGAILRFSTNPTDYLPAVFVRWCGFECYNYSPLIYANNCENVAITGPGILEGQGKSWWPWEKKERQLSEELYQMVLDGVPVEKRVFAREGALRPQMIVTINCRNVLIEGIHTTSGPFWTIQITYCDNVIVRNISVDNEGPNNDGCNLDSSRNAIVEHCIFATNDDSVALKSGMNEDGWRVGRPTENVIVRHCRAQRGHGGIVVGSDMSGGVRNIFVHDCDFSGSDIGIRLKSRPGRGGLVENLWYRDIDMDHIHQHAIIVHTDYRAFMGGTTGKAPIFRNIHIQNVTCGHSWWAARFSGLPEEAIENVTLDNVSLTADEGITCAHTCNLKLNRVAVVAAKSPAIVVKESHGFEMRGGPCPKRGKPYLRIEGSTTNNLRLSKSDCPGTDLPMEVGEEVKPDAVMWR